MLPIDNNRAGNLIRPVALGRSNWLFAGNLRVGKRAAAVTSLIQSAKLNGLEPWAYLMDVLTRLPTQPDIGGGRVRRLDPRVALLIHIDAVWMAVERPDMRAGTESALARVVRVFSAAHPHTTYLFANARANRMKERAHDGVST